MISFKFRKFFLVCVLVANPFWMAISVQAQDASPEEAAQAQDAGSAEAASTPLAQSVTTDNPRIPVPELELLVTPLELSELELEAQAWQYLLKSKVQEISAAEIAIQQQNQIINRREEAATALDQAQQALAEAETNLASATPGTPEYETAAQTLEEAKERLNAAQETLDEASAAAESLREDAALQGALAEAEQTGIFAEARRVLNNARQERESLTAGTPAYQEATAQIDALDSAITATERALEAQQSASPDSPEFETLTQELEVVRETLQQAMEAAATEEENAARILSQARRDREALAVTSLAYREVTQQIRALDSVIEEVNLAQERLEEAPEDAPERAALLATLENAQARLEQATRDAARVSDNAKRILAEDIAQRDTLEEGSPAYTELTQRIETLEAAITEFETAEAALTGLEADTPEYEQATQAFEAARVRLQEETEAATPALEKAQRTLYRARQAQRGFDGSIPEVATQQIEALESAITAYEEAQAAAAGNGDDQAEALAAAEQAMSDAAAAAADASIRLVNAQQLLAESETAREALTPDSPEYTSATEAIEGLQAAIANFESTLAAGGSVAELRDPLRQASQVAIEILPTPSSTPTENTAQTGTGAASEGESSGAQQLEEAASDLQAQAEAEAELKNQLVATVTELQSQRTALADRFKVILDEIDAKGGDTTAYRDYLTAVSGIVIDIQDTEGLGVRIISWLQSEEGGLRWAWNLATFGGIVVGVSIGSQLLAWVIGFGMTQFGGASKVLRQFAVMLISRGGIVVGILLGLTALEVSLGPILALLGGASFVLAFALQSNLGNLASGLMIMVNKPFDIGDEVVVAGVWGFVHSFDITSTRIAGYYCQIFTIPNNAIWSGTIENRSIQGGVRQGLIDVHVPLTCDWKQVAKLLQQTAKDAPDGRLRFASFWSLHEHYAKFRIRWEADHAKFWTAYDQIHMNIKKYLEEAGVPFALPTSIVKYQPADQNGHLTDVEWSTMENGDGDPLPLPPHLQEPPRLTGTPEAPEAKDPAAPAVTSV